jgi:hypothetical protein
VTFALMPAAIALNRLASSACATTVVQDAPPEGRRLSGDRITR